MQRAQKIPPQFLALKRRKIAAGEREEASKPHPRLRMNWMAGSADASPPPAVDTVRSVWAEPSTAGATQHISYVERFKISYGLAV